MLAAVTVWLAAVLTMPVPQVSQGDLSAVIAARHDYATVRMLLENGLTAACRCCRRVHKLEVRMNVGPTEHRPVQECDMLCPATERLDSIDSLDSRYEL